MPKERSITTSTIESICKEFGFGYKNRDGKHFATIHRKEVEIKFGKEGRLRSGKNLFMTEARAASEKFREAYQPSKPSTSEAKENESTQSATEKPKLDRQFLRSYSIEELEAGMKMANDLIDDKRELSKLEKDIEGRGEKLKKLNELVKVMPEMDYELPDGIGDRIAALDGKVKELGGQVEELKKRIESGEPSYEGVADSVAAGSAAVATDESKEPLKLQQIEMVRTATPAKARERGAGRAPRPVPTTP